MGSLDCSFVCFKKGNLWASQFASMFLGGFWLLKICFHFVYFVLEPRFYVVAQPDMPLAM